MWKKNILIGLAVATTILVVLFPVASSITGKSLKAAVEKLDAKISRIEDHYCQVQKTGASISETDITSVPTGTTQSDNPVENAIKKNEQLAEKTRTPDNKPVFELIYNKRFNKGEPEEKEKIAAFCTENQNFIVELRNLAAMGGPFYELDFSNLDEVEVQDLKTINCWVYLLEAHASLAVEAGNYEEAIRDAIAIAAFSEVFGREPIFISWALSKAYDGIVYRLITENIQSENMPQELASQLVEHASIFNGRDACADSMMLEFVKPFLEPIIDKQHRHRTLFERLYSTIGRPLANQDIAIVTDFLERTSDAVRLPYYEAQPAIEILNNEMDDIPFYHFVPRIMLNMMVPNFVNALTGLAYHEAQMGLMQVGLTVEQYHAQHGEYPQTLDQIAPSLNGTVPIDPYTGQTYVYKPEADGFLLYSARGSALGRPVDGTDGDGNIVWRYGGE